MINGSRVLFIGPSFFNYEIAIKATLEEYGAVVDYFDDRPGNDTVSKILLRLGYTFLLRKKMKLHYNELFNLAYKNKYDYIFVVNPEAINLETLNKLKQIQEPVKTILYMWDSFEYKPNMDRIQYFDRVITFDDHDAKRYNLDFLPLFYENMFENIKKTEKYNYDICFIGTAHSDRYKLVKLLQKQTKSLNYRWFSFFYLQSKVMYWGRKLLFPSYKYESIHDFSFCSLKKDEVCNIIQDSRIIVDINGPKQNGLTSRTLEALGAKRKLITTNHNVIKYDFYNPNNILIIDRNNPVIQDAFLRSEYEDVKKDIYEFYSLRSWIRNIFNF